MRLAFKALMNVMLQGDYWGKAFNFPKPEIAIAPYFLQEDAEFNEQHPDLPTYEELYDVAFELTAKYGSPYFDNKIPEYRGAGEGVSCYQCCAYTFKTSPDDADFNDKMYFRNGAHVTMGLMEACEKCNSDNLNHISRITGYLQAVSGWNAGKRQELLDRMRYGGHEVR